METYSTKVLAELGIRETFVQDNHSRSQRGVLRGLHYQLGRPQAKLARVISGEVFDVAVDLRRGSPTFGKWTGVKLSAENKLTIYVPIGFAHGFYVLSESAEFLYKCSDYYAPAEERGVIWNDPQIAVGWPLVGPPILSNKDRAYGTLAAMKLDELPVYGARP
jgi:dTDP-4-dehydrorhamnose 3,5-epimerase